MQPYAPDAACLLQAEGAPGSADAEPGADDDDVDGAELDEVEAGEDDEGVEAEDGDGEDGEDGEEEEEEEGDEEEEEEDASTHRYGRRRRQMTQHYSPLHEEQRAQQLLQSLRSRRPRQARSHCFACQSRVRKSG